MNKYILLLLINISIISCKPNQPKQENILSVSIEPQKYFLDILVGNNFQINTAIPSGANPESYDPSPSQMVKIGKSKIYFKVGHMGLEDVWLCNIATNNPQMKIVDCSEGIKPILDKGHHGVDPHIWSSPQTASIISQNMYDALLKFNPEKKEVYLNNYIKLNKIIQQTDSTIQSYINQSKHKAFVIYHPALTYFAHQYSLKQYSIEVDGKTPSPQQLSQLIKQAKKDRVKVIFLQEEYDPKNVENIAKELDAKIIKINPLAYQWDQEMIKIAKAIAE